MMSKKDKNSDWNAHTNAILRIIMDDSPIGIVAFDKDTRVIYFNPPAERIFGKRSSEFVGIKCGDLIDCANRHLDSNGCGHTQHCPTCIFFRAICTTCSGQVDAAMQQGEVFLEREPDFPAIWVKYKVAGFMIDGHKAAVMTIDDITDQKTNEEKLHAALSELSVIHDHAPISMILVDRKRRIRKANGFAAGFADRPAKEMIGMRGGEAFRCLHHLDDPMGCGFGPACTECLARKAILCTFETAHSQKEVEAWLPFSHGDSITMHCLLISTAYLKIDGMERVLVCTQDITERKQAEIALKKSEKQYRSLFNSILDAILVTDTNRTIIDCNPAFLELFGYSRKEMVGKKTLAIYESEKDFRLMGNAIEENIDKSDFSYTINYKNKNGAVFSGETKAHYLRDNAGKITGFIGLIRDITDRLRAETALRESEEKFRLAFDGTPNAVNVNRLIDGVYVDVNGGFTRLTGFTHEDVVGKTSCELDIWYDPADRKELVRGLQENGFYDNLEAKFRRKDGSLTTAVMSARVFSLRDIPHIISITQDISDRKQAELSRKKLEDQLHHAQKMESVGRLAGGVAHDFNNLLSIILGYSEMILEDVGTDHPHYDPLQEIRSAAERAKILTRHLLAFSRKQALEFTPVDINMVVTGFERLLRRVIGEDISLKLTTTAQPLIVEADTAQLEQVLMNLAVNARDAMIDGGILLIETSAVFLDAVFAEEKEGVIGGEYAMIKVSDTGCGMDSEIIDHIFEPFFTTKDKEKGTGLGLATSYGITKQHGGNICASSKPGKGTTFKIYLPLCTGGTPVETQTMQKRELAAGAATVLIVEDDPSVRGLAVRILKSGGYNVIESDSVWDAIEKAAAYSGEIQLILTDVVMPGLKGPEVFAEIVEHHPKAKVLYMSGYADNVIARQGILQKGIHYIQKPFMVNVLLEKVNNVLNN